MGAIALGYQARDVQVYRWTGTGWAWLETCALACAKRVVKAHRRKGVEAAVFDSEGPDALSMICHD